MALHHPEGAQDMTDSVWRCCCCWCCCWLPGSAGARQPLRHPARPKAP